MGPGEAENPVGKRRSGLTLDIPAITAEQTDGEGEHKHTPESVSKEETFIAVDESPISEAQMESGLGEKLVVVDTIGRGTSGIVSLAVDARAGNVVAVKTISLLDADHRAMLKHEMDALRTQRLELAPEHHTKPESSGSPYIVDFYGAFFSDNRASCSLVVEYMAFGNLQQWVECKEALPEEWIAQIAFQVLGALVYLHEHHIIHRDVKPSNILISKNGNIKLSDFGITREIVNKMGCTSFVGTYNYMSPERLTGEAYSYNSDVWSLGLCLATCILGQCPFPPDQTFWQLLQKLEVPLQMLSSKSMSPEMLDFVSQCLTRDPETRPQAAELLQHPFLRRKNLWNRPKWAAMKALVPSASSFRKTREGLRSIVNKTDARRKNLGICSLLEDEKATRTLAEQLGIGVVRLRSTVENPLDYPYIRQTAGGNRRRLSFAHMKAPWAPQNALSGCPSKDGSAVSQEAECSITEACFTSTLPSLSASNTVPIWRSCAINSSSIGSVNSNVEPLDTSEKATFGSRRKIVPGSKSDIQWSSLPHRDNLSWLPSDHRRRSLAKSCDDVRLDPHRRLGKLNTLPTMQPSMKTGVRNRAVTEGGQPANDGSAMLASCTMLRAITIHGSTTPTAKTTLQQLLNQSISSSSVAVGQPFDQDGQEKKRSLAPSTTGLATSTAPSRALRKSF